METLRGLVASHNSLNRAHSMDSIKALMNKKIFRSREEHHDRNLTRFAVALAAVLLPQLVY